MTTRSLGAWDMLLRTLGFFALTGVLFLAACASGPPLRTVQHVDLERYSGEWYEIAKYPNWFQRHCAKKTVAEYLPQEDGSIAVSNRCQKKDGSIEKAEGRATVVPESGNARLKVSFGGPIAGDYWIIGLDPSYQWALVGHPSRRYLWILARSPELSPEIYSHIVKAAVAQGYEADRIVKTPQ